MQPISAIDTQGSPCHHEMLYAREITGYPVSHNRNSLTKQNDAQNGHFCYEVTRGLSCREIDTNPYIKKRRRG
jgi:hypothetical protein